MSIRRIEVVDRPKGEDDYIEYNIVHEDGSTGGADLRIMDLDENHHMHLLLDRGLPSGSRIAEMFFYPHSDTTQQRQGIGKQVLDTILKDAQDRGIRAVYVEVTDTKAKRFFRKMGFEGNLEPHGYKVISQETSDC